MCTYNMWAKYLFRKIKMSFFLPLLPWKSYFHPFQLLSYNAKFMEFPTDWFHVEVKKKNPRKMNHYLYKIWIKQWSVFIVVEIWCIERMLAIQHWQHHALYIYRFLQISEVVEMHEITIDRELLIWRKKAGDRGEELFVYFIEILI